MKPSGVRKRKKFRFRLFCAHVTCNALIESSNHLIQCTLHIAQGMSMYSLIMTRKMAYAVYRP